MRDFKYPKKKLFKAFFPNLLNDIIYFKYIIYIINHSFFYLSRNSFFFLFFLFFFGTFRFFCLLGLFFDVLLHLEVRDSLLK